MKGRGVCRAVCCLEALLLEAKAEAIKKNVIDQLNRDNRHEASATEVDVKQGTVTLNGTVPSYFAGSPAFEGVRDLPGVNCVHNGLQVSFPPAVSIPIDQEIEKSAVHRLSTNPPCMPPG